MKEFDLLVVGGGSGTDVSDAAVEREMSAAVVEPGPLGGACLTRGCIPSKALVHRADVAETVGRADEFGIDAELRDVDVRSMTAEIDETVYGMAESEEARIRGIDNYALYKEEATFVDERTVDAGGETLRGERVVVATGARSMIPPVDGIEDVEYLTSTEALGLDERPDRLLVVGGGYVGAEMAHVYGSLGVEITMIGRSDTLVDREDADVAETFTAVFEEKYDVYTGYEATEVSEDGGEITVRAHADDGDEIESTGDELLVATGRVPNTDTLDVEAAGIETDDRGFVETNEYLETTAENVWALGDVAGPPLFKHAASHEASYVAMNALSGTREAVEYMGMAHAIFTSPRIASMGKTERELDDAEYVVGRQEYDATPMGMALHEENGFVKVLADPDDGEILGCHVLGPHAPILIHQIVAVASVGGTAGDVADMIHVHPALNEVVLGAFGALDLRGPRHRS